MNIFVALVMGTCAVAALLGSFPDVLPAGTLWPVRLSAILACVLAAPILAAFQTWWVVGTLAAQRYDRSAQNLTVKRIAVFHGLVWAVASVAAFTAIGWPNLVANTFQLQRLPVVYELTVLAPLLVSMILSWLVFYEIQAVVHMPEEPWAPRFGKRLTYV